MRSLGVLIMASSAPAGLRDTDMPETEGQGVEIIFVTKADVLSASQSARRWPSS